MVHVVSSSVPARNGIIQPENEPKLDSFIYLLAFMAVISGFLFGYDTGIVSAAMLYVPKNADLAPMSNVWHEVIVSITPGMAGIGALLASTVADRYGRRKVIIISTIIFTLGAAFCAIGISKWILLFGRVLLGLAIGFASMIVPIYVSESSPAHIRGKLISAFQVMICFGQVSANIFAGGFSYIDPVNWGWRLMFGFAVLPSIIQFIGFCFLPETPRWLFQHRSQNDCQNVLQKIYNGDSEWISYEVNEIKMANEQMKQDDAHFGDGYIISRIFKNPSVRKALLIGSSMQALSQAAGINTIMYYTGAIIKSSGVEDDHTAIWISVGTATVIFLGTLVPMYLVERIGRRKLFLASVFSVLLSLILIGAAFLLINNDSAESITVDNNFFHLEDKNVQHLQRCVLQKNCDFCTTDEHCGFCALENVKSGYCLPKDPIMSSIRSTIGPCSSQSDNTFHIDGNTTYIWADGMCQTKYTVLPILLILFYLFAFGAGYAPLPWVFNAEFYPLWARGTCVAISTFCNWAFNLLISLTFLSLSELVSKFGAFFIYAGITAFAFVLFYFIVPETKGLNLDEVQLLFMDKKERARAVSILRRKEKEEIDRWGKAYTRC